MNSTIAESYVYQNLNHVCDFNESTGLYIYEPAHKLYVVKKADVLSKAGYEAISELNNPHLAKIVYIAEQPDHIEIVREYISGDTLADLLKNGRTVSPDKAVRIASDICDGLADMHRIGYVHRDINPNNIIISSDGCAKIIDYGITRSFSQSKTSDTVIMGTPGYAAPEQFGFSQSDDRTDIYAVGVLLNVMLTGKLPNEYTASGYIGRIIRKCIEVDSRQRYKSISDLRNAVHNRISGNSRMDCVMKKIPGFRNQNAFVSVLATIGYICVIIFSVGIFATVKNGAYIQTAISWILCFPIPYFCFHNFLDIWNRLPFSKGSAKSNQRIVYTVLGILSIFFGLVIFGFINQ